MTVSVDPFAGLPRRHFGCIVADPPWSFKGYTAVQMQNPQSMRAVERHYETMDLPNLGALPVGDLAAPNAHLWLWTTGPNLPKLESEQAEVDRIDRILVTGKVPA